MEFIKYFILILVIVLGGYIIHSAKNIHKIGDATCVNKYKDYPMAGRFILNCTVFGDNFRSNK